MMHALYRGSRPMRASPYPSYVSLLQEQLVPDLLPLGGFVDPAVRIDHDVLVAVEQRLLGPARGYAAELVEQLHAVRRQHEVDEQQRRMRMRRVAGDRQRLRASDQRLDRQPVDRP